METAYHRSKHTEPAAVALVDQRIRLEDHLLRGSPPQQGDRLGAAVEDLGVRAHSGCRQRRTITSAMVRSYPGRDRGSQIYSAIELADVQLGLGVQLVGRRWLR